MMVGRLQGKVAIITGAASGQGAEEARLFAKEGAQVVATDVQTALLSQLEQEIQQENGNVILTITQDVASESGWKQVVTSTIERFHKIDILINNAGVTGKTRGLADTTVSDWNQVMNINALGNYLGMKYVVPEMKKVGQGSIVNISSLAGIHGIGGATPYAASKGATRLLSMGAARDLGPDHIRVNSIHPGFIETPMISDFTKDASVKQSVIDSVPLRYLGKPADVAYAALFLASDEGRFVTGAQLVIDGGQSIKE